jgi:hypothetical protein
MPARPPLPPECLLQGDDPDALRHLLQWVRDETRDKKQAEVDVSEWRLESPKDIPRQLNGCDCGVFAIKFADYLGRNAGFDWGQVRGRRGRGASWGRQQAPSMEGRGGATALSFQRACLLGRQVSRVASQAVWPCTRGRWAAC